MKGYEHMTQFYNNKINYTEIYNGLMSIWKKVEKLLSGLVNTCYLTLILLTLRIEWAPNNASRWQMLFNSEFKITCISVTWFETFGRLDRPQQPYMYCVHFQLIYSMHDHIASGLHDPEGNRCIWLLSLLWTLTPIANVLESLESGYCSEADVIQYIESVSENCMRGFTWRQYMA